VQQAELATLFGNIQAKLRSINRPPYVPPEGLSTRDVEHNMEKLAKSERSRRAALNAHLRQLLDRLRQNFAAVANPFGDSLLAIRAALVSPPSDDLKEQLSFFQNKEQELHSLRNNLPPIHSAEQHCDAAHIEENEYSDHTYDDLSFDHEQLAVVYQKKISFIENQIAASQTGKVSAEQLQEFKESFSHFDLNKNGTLSRLEFKSCLSALGIVKLDFEGGDTVFESIFQKVSNGEKEVKLDQFVQYMISITADSGSNDQLLDAFKVVTGGKDHATESDMRAARMSEEQIAYLKKTLPARAGIEGGYDYNSWLKH